MLYEWLIGPGDAAEALAKLSAGIHRIIENAESLLQDATLLADARRYERADFLSATAREEMAKVYVLIDMCRLDFAKHHAELKRLCHVFYDHVRKHAYFELIAKSWPGIQSMSEVKQAFKVETQKWWPTDPQDGEPSMRHDIYFSRELNLYVDFDDYARTWVTPNSPAKAIQFETEFLSTPISDAMKALDKLKRTRDLKLFDADRLGVLHARFSRRFIDDRTTTEELCKLYRSVGAEIEHLWGVPSGDFEASEVHNWPLYAFT